MARAETQPIHFNHRLAARLGRVLGGEAGEPSVSLREREEMMRIVEAARTLTSAVKDGSIVVMPANQASACADVIKTIFEVFGDELKTLPPFKESGR